MNLASPAALLGRYEIIGPLGQGGYGVVFEARDSATGDRIALKKLLHANAATLARFKNEFRAVQEVHHPNLVRLDALFEDQGKWVIAMELVEGSDLLAHVYDGRGALCFDEPRLRGAFAQLAEGLSALHAAGFVHRDLKPGNVRVTPEGRVVLLDFGLATAVDPRQSMRTSGIGTIAYMAPEQGSTQQVGAEVDWYAFGVCLFEALTGVLPVEGETPLALLLAKQKPIAHTPAELVPGIPADLNDLCVSLLAIAPGARPNGRAVRAVLAGGARRSSRAPNSSPARAGGFEGRELELQALEQAFALAAGGACEAVLVEGESGIGKSALIDRFLTVRATEKRDALVLRSRCYENELLAFKAFDGAVDGLARVLAKLDPADCARLLPPRAALLSRLFPTLASVRPLARAPLLGVAADPGVQRLEAFGLFVRLLAALGERRPIVLAIDDLQWADAESFRLLHALLGAPSQPRCLVLATVRPRAELDGETGERIAALRKLACVSDLPLRGLPRANALALARELMAPEAPDSLLEAIVQESDGHPLFLTVLTRFAGRRNAESAAELTLDAAIQARIAELSGPARSLLETAAMIGTPQAAPLCGRAAGLSESDSARLTAELCGQKLLRRRRAGEIACFHDRIRRVVVANLAVPHRKQLHAQIATELAAHSHSDATELARHYEAAEQVDLAFEAYRRAAEHAAPTLAFDRCAALYGRALDVSTTLGLSAERRTELMIARGHALARGGRSAEAAKQYLEAATHSSGDDRTRLRIWAVQHLLQSARVAEGMAAGRELLAELGVPLPKSTGATLARLLWDRTYLGVRGVHVTPTDAPIPVKARMQLEALWGMSMPVGWLDPLANAVLITRHLRIAHAHRAPAHMARALSEEAFARTIKNAHDPEADRLLARARELGDPSKDPVFDVVMGFREGVISNFRWDLLRSQHVLERAQQVGTESCPDQPWLLTNVRAALGSVWANSAEHARLAVGTSTWIAEARERNDQFALSMLEGIGFGWMRHLMADDPDLGRQSIDAALSPWPAEPFSFAHFGELVAIANIELYRGGDQGYRWIERELRRLTRAFVLKVGFGKVCFLMYHSHSCLAARNVATRQEAQQLVAKVKEDVRQLERIDNGLARVNIGSLEAQLAALAGDTDQALAKLRAARAESLKCGGLWLGCTLDYLEGVLEGGDGGREKRDGILARFEQQGWKKPRRLLSLLCPVLDALE
jgi:hypothetical protein